MNVLPPLSPLLPCSKDHITFLYSNFLILPFLPPQFVLQVAEWSFLSENHITDLLKSLPWLSVTRVNYKVLAGGSFEEVIELFYGGAWLWWCLHDYMHLSKHLELYTKKGNFTLCRLYLSTPDFKKEKKKTLEILGFQLCPLINNEILSTLHPLSGLSFLLCK